MAIQDDNFYTVIYWMISDLGLKGAELPIFAIIYGFSQDGVNKFTGSLNYLAGFANVSRQTVIDVLKRLIDANYIIKEQKVIDKVKCNAYWVNLEVVKKFDWGSQKTLMGQSNNLTGGSQKTLPNNIDIKDIDNKEIDYSAIANVFNSICTSLPKVKVLTDTRKTHLNTFLDILKKYDLSIEEYFKRVQASDFLSGRNKQWSNCSFDWLIKRENTLKVCENNYINKKTTKPQTYSEY